MPERDFQVGGEILKHTGGYQHVIGIDYPHHEIHDGDMWFTGMYWSSIANAGTARFTYYAGTVMPHLFFEVAVGGNCKMTKYEGGTITGGTAVSIFNHVRSSTNTHSGSATHAGTRTGGTALVIRYIPGGGKNFGSGASGRSTHEIVGLVGKPYTVELVNVSGDTIAASIELNWYNHNV